MNIYAITNAGIEHIAQKEVHEILGKQCTKEAGAVSFSSEDEKDIFRLAYKAQSISKIILVLDKFKIKNLFAQLEERIKKFDTNKWIKDSFIVNCTNEEKDDYVSQDVSRQTAEFIKKTTGRQVLYKNPDTSFFILIRGGMCTFGIDMTGDLSKREYRIHVGSDWLKGTVAYAMVRESCFSADKCLVDPFCRSGTIVIEAALFALGKSVHFFEKDKFLFRKLKPYADFDFDVYFEGLDVVTNAETNIIALDNAFRDVQAAKKNAKIAGVMKQISFSRKDLEWIDLKLGKETADCLVTVPLQSGRTVAESTARKLAKELFYQAEYVLKKEGKIVLLVRKDRDLLETQAAEYGFKMQHEHKIMQGLQELLILVFSR